METQRRPRKSYFFRQKKKVCMFCARGETIDYKDTQKLSRFISDKGKILPRRVTGLCAKHQRQVAVAIKRARVMALLPFVKS